MSEKLTFTDSDSGETMQLYILEQTKINNVNYILVTDSDDDGEDAQAYILKDISREEDAEALYEPVEDDNELNAVSKVFAELLDDIDIE